MPRTTYVRKVKRPTGSGLWPTYWLGDDEFGTWFYTPRHSTYRGEDGESSGTCEVAQGPDGVGEHVVHLVPADGWWFAFWRLGGLIHADVCTPPALIGDEWTYVDLELDPFRKPNGLIGTEDWDELDEAHAAGLVTIAEKQAAEAAARDLEQWFADGSEPFGQVGWNRLAAAIALDLPPLHDFGDRPLRLLP